MWSGRSYLLMLMWLIHEGSANIPCTGTCRPHAAQQDRSGDRWQPRLGPGGEVTFIASHACMVPCKGTAWPARTQQPTPVLCAHQCWPHTDLAVLVASLMKSCLIRAACVHTDLPYAQLSRRVLAEGGRVVMAVRDVKLGEAAAKQLGHAVKVVPLDAAQPKSVDTLVEWVKGEMDQQINFLVNNAAVYPVRAIQFFGYALLKC